MNRGILRKNQKQWDASADDYAAAQQLCSGVTEAPDCQPGQANECRVLLAKCHLNRGVLFRERYLAEKHPETLDAAREAFRQAIATLTSTGPEQPSVSTAPQQDSLELARYRNNLAVSLLTGLNQLDDSGRQQHLELAEQEISQAVAICERLNVGTRETRVELAGFYNTRAYIASQQQADAAFADWTRAAAVLQTIHEQNPNDALAGERLGMILCNLCEAWQKQDRHDEALQAIAPLLELPCGPARFEKAARLMQTGLDQLSGQESPLADRYRQLHDEFTIRQRGN